MIKIYKRITCVGITRVIHIRSLVRTTGLLVCVGACLAALMLAGCGSEPVMYDAGTEMTGDKEAMTESGNDEIEEVSTEEKMLIVHLCGAVNNPGVYELSIDSRIIDGINEAGGFREDASEDSLNLAMELTDGSRIYVPTVSEMEEGSVTVDVTAPEKPGKVNINTADIVTLTTLSGIGESRAKGIIAYREEHGGFKSIEEIMNVSGIGQASFEKLKDDITV